MSLSAREQQALDSIKEGLAGSDPDLAALLSAFTGLASGEDMPDEAAIQAGSRRALSRLRRPRGRSNWRRACQRLVFQWAAPLLWLLISAVSIAVALALNAGGDRAPCTETVAMVCVDLAPQHSPAPTSHGTATDRAARQPAAGTRPAGPSDPSG
jgi:Protein of unknown function (DUF3040)